MKKVLFCLVVLASQFVGAAEFKCLNQKCQAGSQYCLITGRADNPSANYTYGCTALPKNYKNDCGSLMEDARALFPNVANCKHSVLCNIRGQDVQVRCQYDL